ncbi:MAG: GNAT family N-acetyltransferase, partial [Clostridia bacterium]
MDLDIDKAQMKDIDEVEKLYNDVCDSLSEKKDSAGWTKGDYPTKNEALEFFANDALYVAKSGGKIVGTIALTHKPDSDLKSASSFVESDYVDVFFVRVFAVHPDYLHKGIGTAILKFSEERGRQEDIKFIRLCVYEYNLTAIKIYEKNGYKRIDKV